MTSETKIDDSFPVGNFITEGFSSPYRLDCDSNGGGIMLYVREYIRSNLLATEKKHYVVKTTNLPTKSNLTTFN